MIHCGTLDDVYSYEKMKHDRRGDDESPRLSSRKTASFRKSDSPQQPPTLAKLGSKRSASFRRIFQQSDRSSCSKTIAMQDMKESSISSLSPPKKPKERSKGIGFVDILLGYHSLLQASPGFSVARQRKELFPTIGFTQDPDYGPQQQQQ